MLDESKPLLLNLYEIVVNNDLLKDTSTLNSFLLNCKCALFLIDIMNEKSFVFIKKLIIDINTKDFPYLKAILVQNKKDSGSDRVVSQNEIEKLIQLKPWINTLEVSLKNKENMDVLLNQIYSLVNEKKNNLPCDLILESLNKSTNFIDYSGTLSFILIGDSSVGKSCFFKRYFRNEFVEEKLSTIGIDRDFMNIKIEEKLFKITVWDTCGQEKFKFLPKSYYKNADGIFLFFDVTSKDSFDNVSNWINDVKENAAKRISDNDIEIFLIGNKIDLPGREISKEQAELQANSLGMKYFEISCKINMNIPEVVHSMIIECYKKYVKKENGFQINKKKKDKKGSCC